MRFSHVYVEEKACDHPLTQSILAKLPNSTIIPIRHYKDVFNRKGQDINVQLQSPKLILAVNNGQRIYKGAPVCHDYGEDEFCYTSNVMNCLFDCDYCFLKGMYPSGNIVVFVNFDDYVRDVIELMKDKKKIFLSVSYESDLLALDGLTGMASRWIELALDNPGLTIELRTKSAPRNFVLSENIIYAFSLLPQEVITGFEHGTAPLDLRLKSIATAQTAGAEVRLCFDPLIYVNNYEEVYGTFTEHVCKAIDITKVRDLSIGTFRISGDYLKNLRRCRPDSSCVQYPFRKEDGYAVYPEKLKNRMISIITEKLKEKTDDGRIFII